MTDKVIRRWAVLQRALPRQDLTVPNVPANIRDGVDFRDPRVGLDIGVDDIGSWTLKGTGQLTKTKFDADFGNWKSAANPFGEKQTPSKDPLPQSWDDFTPGSKPGAGSGQGSDSSSQPTTPPRPKKTEGGGRGDRDTTGMGNSKGQAPSDFERGAHEPDPEPKDKGDFPTPSTNDGNTAVGFDPAGDYSGSSAPPWTVRDPRGGLGMPTPDGDGPMGPVSRWAMPNPDGDGPMGPLSRAAYPNPDGTGPMGPTSRLATVGWLNRVLGSARTR